jgi:AcrR family transcriptional regulator
VATRPYNSARRALASLQTRDAILAAAVDLFGSCGYARTTIAGIARQAGVATNTVYTSVGGKPDLVRALIERATGAEVIERTLAEIDAATSGRDVIRLLAHGYRMSLESDSAVVGVMQDAARHDPGIAGAFAEAKALYRQRLNRVGAHLRELGAIRAPVGDSEVCDVLWLYFGLTTWQELREMGWPPERIEPWLAARAGEALLAPGQEIPLLRT